MIDKLKEVLKEYQDEPCTLQGVKCRDCKYNMRIDEVYDEDGEGMKLCWVLDSLSNELEVE